MNEKTKEAILKSYKDFLKEKDLEDNFVSLKLYLSYIFYDIQDNLDIEIKEFNVPQYLEGSAIQEDIEGKIINIIKNFQENKIKDLLYGMKKTFYNQDFSYNERIPYMRRLSERYNCVINMCFGIFFVDFNY